MLPPPLQETLSELITELQNIWIEKEAYRQLILLSLVTTPEQLQEVADQALANPDRRERARELFGDMRKKLVEAGNAAEIEELLSQPLKSDKPN